MSTYGKRREAFGRALGEGVAVLPAARHASRNADVEYEYRQNSDFYYLTGFSEPEAVLVLAPSADTERTVLFLRPRDRGQEIWTGKRLGVEDAPQHLGVDAAYPIDELAARLPALLTGASTLYYALGNDEPLDRLTLSAVKEARYRVRRGGLAPHAFVDPGTLLHEMRLHKTSVEIETMRRAAAATRAGHEAGMRATRPGLYEYELEAVIEYEYRLAGAQDT